MIAKASRYVDGLILHEPATDTVMVRRRFPDSPNVSQQHIWSDSDRLDLLAARYLGDSTLWWRIMDCNPLIQDPSSIRPGTVLVLP